MRIPEKVAYGFVLGSSIFFGIVMLYLGFALFVQNSVPVLNNLEIGVDNSLKESQHSESEILRLQAEIDTLNEEVNHGRK